MASNWLPFALLASLALSGQQAHAQDSDRAFTSGLSLGLGVGMENSGLGAHALYYVQLSERWRLAPHIGVGWIGGTGVAGGLMATFGRRHRLVLDALGGPMAADGGTDQPTDLYYGVCVLVGWEWMASSGLTLRSSIGPSYRPEFKPSPDRFFFALNILSIDYKFW
jgi:hypothetical protein